MPDRGRRRWSAHVARMASPLDPGPDAQPVHVWSFAVLCAIAGALAVRPHPVASPVSAVVALLLGRLGLRVWRWSRLPRLNTAAAHGVVARYAISLGLGLLMGLLVLAAIRLVIEPALPAAGVRIAAAAALPVWRRMAIIYVAAVGEELIFRLLLLSLVAGLLARFTRSTDGTPTQRIAWFANALAALAFAAVHLPAWTAIGTLSLGLLVMVLTLNGLAGLVCGHIFVRYGIVAAIWTHAGGDCAIQLIGPLTA